MTRTTKTAQVEKIDVRNRWSGSIQFTAEIETTPDMTPRVKLGLAVRWGHKRGADLSGAVLSGADLSGADLSGADLRGADLRGADLSGAVLSGADLRGAVLSGADLRGAVLSGADLRDADLRHIKADFWMILTMARAEVPALIAALREGRVNGSTYHGECACLCGSLENAGSAPLPHNADSPAESWFMPIREGDKPDSESEGGFRSKLAIEWALEFCAFNGINPDKTPKSASKRKAAQ